MKLRRLFGPARPRFLLARVRNLPLRPWGPVEQFRVLELVLDLEAAYRDALRELRLLR